MQCCPDKKSQCTLRDFHSILIANISITWFLRPSMANQYAAFMQYSGFTEEYLAAGGAEENGNASLSRGGSQHRFWSCEPPRDRGAAPFSSTFALCFSHSTLPVNQPSAAAATPSTISSRGWVHQLNRPPATPITISRALPFLFLSKARRGSQGQPQKKSMTHPLGGQRCVAIGPKAR